MASTIVLQAKGLNISPNALDLPPGSLSKASNVIIRRDDVIEQRRGYKLYGNSFGTTTDRASQLFAYRNRILRQYSQYLQYDSDGQGEFLTFSGTYQQAQSGLRTKSTESNGNFYFTSSEGIKLISASSNSQFTTSANYITNAGVPKAIDLIAENIAPSSGSTGFLPQNSTVAYKVAWAIKDANANLKIGTPSQYVSVYSYILDLLIPNYMSTLEALDEIYRNPVSTAFFGNYGNYVNTLKVGIDADPITLGSNLTSLATQIDNDIRFANDTGAGSVPLTLGGGYRYIFTITAPGANIPTGSVYTAPNATTFTTIKDTTSTDTTFYTTGSGDPDAAPNNLTGPTPLTYSAYTKYSTYVVSVGASSSTVRIYFSAGTPSTYFSSSNNRQIYLEGFGKGTISTKDINGQQLITNVGSDYIEFVHNSVLDIADTFSIAGATVRSGKYRAITQPLIPSVPATAAQLESLQTYLETIINNLQQEYTYIISATNLTTYLDPLTIDTSTNVQLNISIPQDITSSHFIQVYRSSIITATGTDVLDTLSPNPEETQLVYEAYPTVAELSAGYMIIDDVTPDLLRGANLYTNAASGEGILQANDIPPFALDINKFKNYTFFANTKTRHRLVPFSLLGVGNMVSDYNSGTTPTLTIATESGSNTYTFVTGIKEQTEIQFVADFPANTLDGKYFTLNSAYDTNEYYVWYSTGAGAPDPAIVGKTGIRVNILAGSTAANVAKRTADVLSTYVNDFTITTKVRFFVNTTTGISTGDVYSNNNNTFTAVSSIVPGLQPLDTIGTGFPETPSPTAILTKVSGNPASEVSATYLAININTIIVTNLDNGATTNSTSGTSGFTLTTAANGRGEDISNKQVLLSDNISVATAIDETARSLVRVINATNTEVIYAFYTSTLGQTPGKMVLENRSLTGEPFYLISNNENTGKSFFPNIDPVVILTSSPGRISAANPTVITSTTHGLINNDKIVITDSDSTPSIDGIYSVTVTGINTFTIPVNVTVAGTKLSYSKLEETEVSDNEEKVNRVYFSKLSQPEAVPIVNYLDIGASDHPILRIIPLRDSLFIFKEDGLYRVSGETAPFYTSIFDSSCICIAADSVSIANNLIYAYTRQGISTISEAGVTTISRPIDSDILKISTSQYTNFSTATWGVGYESDNSYTVYTVSNITDDHATIAYRYSNLTNTWTTVDKDSVCGMVNPTDDKLYLGAGDTHYIEQERKTFSRLDYMDREFASYIYSGNYVHNQIQLPTVSHIAIGDVIEQQQNVTPYKYNMLLKKLDTDPSISNVNISAISGISNVLTITTDIVQPPHNLTTGDYVTIINNTSTPSINGTYQVTYIDPYNFQITVPSPLLTTVANGVAGLNYYETLKCEYGNDLRTKLVDLANKLDGDPGLTLTNYLSIIDSYTSNISTISDGSTPTITTTANHNLLTGRYVTITNSTCVPSVDGNHVVTVTGLNTFTIDQAVNTAQAIPFGTISTNINTFEDILGCFNILIDNLNIDPGASFNNYKKITDTTTIETIITAVDPITKKITLNNTLDFIVGPVTIYKAIESTIIYSPITMGDTLGLKQMREATIMFLNRAFSSATLSFATDLLPEFTPVTFTLDGNGIFGSGDFGSGYFGGSSNSAPMRTYIPRNAQRCRYMVIKFTHKTARESYSIYGITLTGEIGQSTRAYR